MWFDSILDSLARSRQRRKQRATDRKQKACRLLLEGLEDRCLLAFNLLAEYPVGPSPVDVMLARLDADSRLDVLTASSSVASVSFLACNGNGTFDIPATTSATVAPPHSVAAGDFDGDGVVDLVTADTTSLGLLKGNGDGSFQTPIVIPIPFQLVIGHPEAGPRPQYLSSVAVGDLNEDGYLDLVATGNTSWWAGPYGGFDRDGYVNVLIGNGSGGFAPAVVRRLGQSLGPVAIADLNQDGHADILTTVDTQLGVLLGDGTGTLGSPIISGVGGALSSLSLGDIDGDGKLDTVLAWGDGLIVQKGQGDGTFVPSTSVMLEYGSLDSAVVGDVNADGKLDLVAVGSPHTCTDSGYYGCYAGYDTKQATVFLGNGQGGFLLPITSTWGTIDGTGDNALWYSDLALADLTGDGLPELVAIENMTGVVDVAEGSWPDTPTLTIENVSVVEGDAGSALVSISFSLSAPYSQAVTANYQTVDGTASAGSDYVSNSGSITFAPGDITKTITLEVYGDRLPEADESLSIVLSNVVNALVANVGTVTILDNEPRISINHPYGSSDELTVYEGDGGTTPAVFTVTLARPYDQEATVDYYTETGWPSAIVATSGTLRFAPGQTSKTITVQVINDLISEGLEAFDVVLTNPSPNATLVNGGGYCYIVDNDWAPKVKITDVKQTEGNSGTKSFTFTISLSFAASWWVYVNFTTADGTATVADNDYVAKSGTVAFAPGQKTAKISVTVRGDTKKEADETFFVNLTGTDGGWIADSQGVGTITNDDGGRSGQSGQSLLAAAVIDDSLNTHRKRK